MKGHPDFTVAMVIPTGVGASQGGYGGDATVWMNLLASVCDTLVTHPNVANAAAFQALPSNALYVEGYGLDAFFKGDWGLCPVLAQRLGKRFIIMSSMRFKPPMACHLWRSPKVRSLSI
jgi:hypothetical protein